MHGSIKGDFAFKGQNTVAECAVLEFKQEKGDCLQLVSASHLEDKNSS